MSNKSFIPYVSAKKIIPELTPKAVVLGVVLTLMMCAANTYLGLYAGMTVSASIPAAVISMGLLRGIIRKGTILENNIVQTIASAGESLAAGIIFTMPALVIAGIWAGFRYWTITLVALLGGILGVLFMIPLRRTLIVEETELIYPEGVACGEVLKTGERGGTGVLWVFSALGLGALFKFLTKGFSVIKGVVEGATRLGETGIYFGSDISVALLGVGYIVGPNVATLVFIGGAIGWLFGIPIYGLIQGLPAGNALDASWEVWSTQIRYMGVGAMVVGGLWSIIKVRKGIAKSIKEAVLGYRAGATKLEPARTGQDMPARQVAFGLLLVAVPILLLYSQLTGSVGTGVVSGVAMIIAGFFFVAVSSYVVGLVGSSNNPVSGMTICTILFASALLLVFGMTGRSGILATLGVAGVVCCAACTAGDVSQDLKTGYILGATPKKQQWAQLIGVAASAFIIAPVLVVLHQAYGIGTQQPGALPAPQASLFASLVKAMFTDRALPWNMVGIGAAIGIGLILIDEVLRQRSLGFRAYVMPVAVGIYLPFSLSVPIMAGGLIHGLVKSLTARAKSPKEATQHGILFSSGLIAGEAIMGIIIAVLIFGKIELPIKVIESDPLSILAFLGMMAVLTWVALKGRKART